MSICRNFHKAEIIEDIIEITVIDFHMLLSPRIIKLSRKYGYRRCKHKVDLMIVYQTLKPDIIEYTFQALQNVKKIDPILVCKESIKKEWLGGSVG